MEATRRDASGFSLLELLIVCTLLGLTLAAAYAVLSTVSLTTNNLSARVNATGESQAFIDQIGDELMQANSLKSLASTATANPDAQAAFYDVAPREIGFYADLNHDGKPERVAYFMSGASLLRQQATASNLTYPYSWAASSTPQVMIQTIDPSWAGPIFIYDASGGWPPVTITSASQAASITAVTVQVQNTATVAGRTVSYDASATVRVRAMGNAF
jgi:prepilin-type N-terminal cleavage/methylation domain-containing protein